MKGLPPPLSATPTRQAPPAAGAPLLTLHEASVSFGGRVALRPLSLTLARGERLALIGANGSGKTTLLRLLHGLVPHDGTRTEHAAGGPAQGLRSAMLFQRPFLLNLSVAFNVEVGLWLAGVRGVERQRRGSAALARVGLAEVARRRARELSGGQQQRLALARAWALEPDILFLDEPTASLDPGAKREVETAIAAMAEAGLTLVMSTHNLGQAKRLATRVAYLEGGRLLADLPVDAFFGHDAALPEAVRQFLKGERAWIS